jgi:hypothetical protein
MHDGSVYSTKYSAPLGEALVEQFGEEPVFLLRAKDALSLATLHQYAEMASRAGCDPSFLEGVRQATNSFEDWQIKNSSLVRRPD